MKRLLLACLMILCLVPLSRRAETPNDAWIELPCSKEGVAEFMAAFSLAVPDGIVQGYRETEDCCYNVTPINVAQETDIRVFKFSDSAASYAYVDGAVCDLCRSIGGYGFLNAVPWDDDQDGQMDLLIASSWGSGISRSELSVFNRAAKTASIIYSTLYEDEPQIDLIVCLDAVLADRSQKSQPRVILRRVQVSHPKTDFAHLSYRIIGEYHPTQPFALPEAHSRGVDAAKAPRQRFWGSYTDKKTYSFDRKYYAIQHAEDGMIKVTVHLTSSNEAVCEFTPARSMDFWGICWERDTYTIWTQSADIGHCGYELHDGVWERNDSLKPPAYIISRWDDDYRNDPDRWDSIYMSPTGE